MDFNQLWKAAPTTEAKSPDKVPGDFSPIPTGEYDTSLNFTQIDLTGPVPKVKMRFRILAGEFNGRILFSDYQLTEKGIPFLKKDLAKMGYTDEPANMDALSKALQSFVNKKFKVKAVKRIYLKKDGSEGVAHNVYINSVLADDHASDDQDVFSF